MDIIKSDPKYAQDMLKTWSELDLLIGLIFGEARSESWSGKVGVGLVVQNRVRHPGFWNWGYNWREVILCPKQFSCFNQADPNLKELMGAEKIKGAVWQECAMIAEQIYLGRIKDFVGGPSHYHGISVSPSWNKDLRSLGTIGNHKFYSCF
jgi:N-acetylmuramoyl-L-alanine amidase